MRKWGLWPHCSETLHYLGSGLDLLFTDETLLDARWTQWAGCDVATRAEQRVPLHVGAHHTLLQGLVVAVQRRAAGAHLPTERHVESERRMRSASRAERGGRGGERERTKRGKRTTWRDVKMDESRKEPGTVKRHISDTVRIQGEITQVLQANTLIFCYVLILLQHSTSYLIILKTFRI